MARIRIVEIQRYRGIEALSWQPSDGINCLIGPGDSGKSTILDAIDLCLGARRNITFDDSDFFELDVDQPIVIKLTLGELDDHLMAIEPYALFLHGFRTADGTLVDEPEAGTEPFLGSR